MVDLFPFYTSSRHRVATLELILEKKNSSSLAAKYSIYFCLCTLCLRATTLNKHKVKKTNADREQMECEVGVRLYVIKYNILE